ncbi:hypothetical protein F5Y16DRAFT_384704 [Xylariaceae sp. FL0255]|nr:hypothetical protein F5Y16DRAFT_384704 [Xylariaceae sp. FL0255]
MAEVAAGLWAAEEVVSTGIQAGLAGYAVSKPTVPLKATFSQLASTSDTDKGSLARSCHSLAHINKRIYIFGGLTGSNDLATTDIHSIALPVKDSSVPDYKVSPAIPAAADGAVPAARAEHAACALGSQLAIHGGRDSNGDLIDEGSVIWLFDTEKSTWQKIEPASHPERTPPPRRKACLLAHDGNLVLYGGVGSDGSDLTDIWHFNVQARVWNQLPQAPVSTTSAAISGDTLYLIAATDSLSNEVHHLDINLWDQDPPTWSTMRIPTNPLTPGPKPRQNGALVPVTTGFGRNFLLYFFGEDPDVADDRNPYWSDLWTFQLPSSKPRATLSTDMAEAIKPAKIKDKVRSQVGADTGEASWAEVEVQPPNDSDQAEGKAHPGPRGLFGYDVTSDGNRVVLWGGVDAAGRLQGDGWVITLT